MSGVASKMVQLSTGSGRKIELREGKRKDPEITFNDPTTALQTFHQEESKPIYQELGDKQVKQVRVGPVEKVKPLKIKTHLPEIPIKLSQKIMSPISIGRAQSRNDSVTQME